MVCCRNNHFKEIILFFRLMLFGLVIGSEILKTYFFIFYNKIYVSKLIQNFPLKIKKPQNQFLDFAAFLFKTESRSLLPCKLQGPKMLVVIHA